MGLPHIPHTGLPAYGVAPIPGLLGGLHNDIVRSCDALIGYSSGQRGYGDGPPIPGKSGMGMGEHPGGEHGSPSWKFQFWGPGVLALPARRRSQKPGPGARSTLAT